MKIVEYSVVRGATITEVVRNMRRALDDGFEPIGGIVVDLETRVYIQAVVVYDYSFQPESSNG